jgi:SAM-dependent methyltransferase
MLPPVVLRVPGVPQAIHVWFRLVARAYDLWHGVRTTGNVALAGLRTSGDPGPGQPYEPTHVHAARRVFGDLGIADFTPYTFVDLGSGKGRMLFLAAEHPFRRIIGVEFARELHEIATRNVRSFRSPRQRCTHIDARHANAVDFEFPPEPVVLYLFNPFGRAILEPIIRTLDASLDAHPRDVVVVLMNPEEDDVIRHARRLTLLHQRPYYNVYRSMR